MSPFDNFCDVWTSWRAYCLTLPDLLSSQDFNAKKRQGNGCIRGFAWRVVIFI